METYHDFHDELIALFSKHELSDIQSMKDINGRLRFVEAMKR